MAIGPTGVSAQPKVAGPAAAVGGGGGDAVGAAADEEAAGAAVACGVAGAAVALSGVLRPDCRSN